MRKLTVVFFALFVTVSAFAAPPNDSADRGKQNPIMRIIQKIKLIVRALDDGGPIAPIPLIPQ